MSFQIKTVSILKIEITLISKEAFSSFFQILFHQDENDNNGLTRAAISSSGEVLVKKFCTYEKPWQRASLVILDIGDLDKLVLF